MSGLGAVFSKELKVEFRNKQMIVTYFILSVMIIVTFRLAFSGAGIAFTELASPVIWTAFFLSGMFSISFTYKREMEERTMEGLLLAPLKPSTIYFGKLFGNFVVISFMEIFLLILFFVFFPVEFPDLPSLLLIMVLGTVGFTALGNLLSAVTSNLTFGTVMLPVLMVPVLLFTIIMSAVSATAKVFSGAHIADVQNEIRLLLAFDVVFVALGYLLIDFVLGE